MKELNDEDFDQAFKNRITQEIPEFDNESWLKMEEKLRKKDRLIFYRYASVVLLLLSFGLGFYLISRNGITPGNGIAGNKPETKKELGGIKDSPSATSVASSTPNVPLPTINPGENVTKIVKDPISTISKGLQAAKLEGLEILVSGKQPAGNEPGKVTQNSNQSTLTTKTNVIDIGAENVEQPNKQPDPVIAANIDDVKLDGEKPEGKIKKVRRKLPLSLAINVGPDFNSTTSVIGGKANVAFGVSLGVGLTKKLSLQTGLNYGHKNYTAVSNEYTTGYYPKNTIVNIDAQCKVLEIPLRASFKVNENNERSITVNAGLSSYMMLKENYVFKYDPSLKRADRTSEVTNSNQHILSVVDLSATYNIKSKSKKIAVGLEPYIKIPLSGIGEGSVPLKSSGVSLKLSYDFTKKH